MAKNKTARTEQSVTGFLNNIADEAKQADSFKLVELMQQASGFEAKMWGPNIVGFGSYHYKYASGHEGDAPLAAFSPRAKEFSIYLSLTEQERPGLLQKFGKHRAATSCIYVKRLSDIDGCVLNKMVRSSVKNLQTQYS